MVWVLESVTLCSPPFASTFSSLGSRVSSGFVLAPTCVTLSVAGPKLVWKMISSLRRLSPVLGWAEIAMSFALLKYLLKSGA